MCPSCHAHVLPGFPSPLWVPEGRRSTLTVCSQSLSRKVQGCILHSSGNRVPPDGDLHTACMLHSLWFCLKSPLPPVNASMTQPGRCAAAPAGPKQVTANTGEETLSLQNPKFSSFTGTKTTTEQFVAHVSSSSHHTVHLRKKRGFHSEKKTLYFLSQHPLGSHWHSSRVLCAQHHSHTLGTSWGSGPWVELHSCCCLSAV